MLARQLGEASRFPGRFFYKANGHGRAMLAPTSPLKLKLHLFRQVCRGRIVASRAVYPLYRNIRAAAAGGIYAAPTTQPVIFAPSFDRGRGVPRPYKRFRQPDAITPRQTMQIYKRPSAAPMAPIRAKKPSILTSFQPRSSKAWWMGVIRKMRLPWVALK